MTVHEYGTENRKTLLFFPGSCTRREDYLAAARLLGKAFRVLLVTPDGHDPAEHTDFISVEKTVDDVAAWLKAHGINRLDALYGLSFGGGMALRFLTTRDITSNPEAIPSQIIPTMIPVNVPFPMLSVIGILIVFFSPYLRYLIQSSWPSGNEHPFAHCS